MASHRLLSAQQGSRERSTSSSCAFLSSFPMKFSQRLWKASVGLDKNNNHGQIMLIPSAGHFWRALQRYQTTPEERIERVTIFFAERLFLGKRWWMYQVEEEQVHSHWNVATEVSLFGCTQRWWMFCPWGSLDGTRPAPNTWRWWLEVWQTQAETDWPKDSFSGPSRSRIREGRGGESIRFQMNSKAFSRKNKIKVVSGQGVRSAKRKGKWSLSGNLFLHQGGIWEDMAKTRRELERTKWGNLLASQETDRNVKENRKPLKRQRLGWAVA